MPDVRMEDGTLIRDVPEGTTQEGLLAQLEAYQGQEERPANRFEVEQQQLKQQAEEAEGFSGAAMLEGAGRRLTDNLLGAPRAMGTLLADGTALLETAGGAVNSMVAGRDVNFGENLDANIEKQRNLSPAKQIRSLPAPTSIDLQSAAKTAGELLERTLSTPMDDGTMADELLHQDTLADRQPLPTFTENRDFQQDALLDRRAENPTEFAGGDLLGDAATLMTGRTPLVLGRRNKAAASTRIAGAADDIPAAGTEGYFSILKDRFKNPIKSGRSATRNITETGLEGAMLAAMNDQDPLTAFGLAAGSQAMGSGFRGASSGIWKNLALAGAGTIAVIHTFKEATPGGRDRILESSEEGFEKVALALGLGAMATITGFGRGSERVMNARGLAPALADASHTLRRGPMLSMLNGLQNDPDQLLEKYFTAVADNPDQFDEVVNRRMLRALEGNGPDPLETLKLLQSDRRFRRQMNEISVQNTQQGE